jgi:hypothetical protein
VDSKEEDDKQDEEDEDDEDEDEDDEDDEDDETEPKWLRALKEEGGGYLFRVKYSDGDEEELHFGELLEVLVPSIRGDGSDECWGRWGEEAAEARSVLRAERTLVMNRALDSLVAELKAGKRGAASASKNSAVSSSKTRKRGAQKKRQRHDDGGSGRHQGANKRRWQQPVGTARQDKRRDKQPKVRPKTAAHDDEVDGDDTDSRTVWYEPDELGLPKGWRIKGVRRKSTKGNAPYYDKYYWPPTALQQRATLFKEIKFNSLLGAKTFARDRAESAFELKCGWMVMKRGGKGGKDGKGGKGGKGGGARASPRGKDRGRSKGKRKSKSKSRSKSSDDDGNDGEEDSSDSDDGDADVDMEDADGMNEDSEGDDSEDTSDDSDDSEDSDDDVGDVGDVGGDVRRVLATSLLPSPPSLPLSPLSMAPTASAWRPKRLKRSCAVCGSITTTLWHELPASTMLHGLTIQHAAAQRACSTTASASASSASSITSLVGGVGGADRAAAVRLKPEQWREQLHEWSQQIKRTVGEQQRQHQFGVQCQVRLCDGCASVWKAWDPLETPLATVGTDIVPIQEQLGGPPPHASAAALTSASVAGVAATAAAATAAGVAKAAVEAKRQRKRQRKRERKRQRKRQRKRDRTSGSGSGSGRQVARRSQPLYYVGAKVEGRYDGGDEWYPGTITGVYRAGSNSYCDIWYDDGDTEERVSTATGGGAASSEGLVRLDEMHHLSLNASCLFAPDSVANATAVDGATETVLLPMELPPMDCGWDRDTKSYRFFVRAISE